MKQTVGFTLSAIATVTLLAILYSGAGIPAAEAQAKTLDGKAIFLAQKCNMCHMVSSAGIEATTKSEKMKGPDITDNAAKEDAAVLIKFLRKQGDLNGKKHTKAFTGSDEELGALIAWMQKQKK
jgi:mono/diheme cytochrome c family protein